jgi:hypothetical protein
LLGRIFLYLHHGFYFVIFVCPHGRFSNLHYYNINKSIKLVYVCHAHVGTSSPLLYLVGSWGHIR